MRENIAAFGGDPAQVTVFGLSAGGGLGIHLLASPAAAGLFSGLIVQSGITDRTLDAERGALVAETLCAALDVDDIERLAALPVDAILAAQAAVVPQLLKPVGMMPFHPCVDGELLTAAPAAALATGVGADVPLLAGTTSEEMNLFLGLTAPVQRDRLVSRVARYVGVDETTSAAVVERYAADVGIDGVWPALFTDVEMQIPLRRVLTAWAKASPTSTFAYLFTWSAPNWGPSTRSTSRSRSTCSTSTAGASSSASTPTRTGSGSSCAPRGPGSHATASPAGSRIPRPMCSDASRSTRRSHPLFDRQQDYWRG